MGLSNLNPFRLLSRREGRPRGTGTAAAGGSRKVPPGPRAGPLGADAAAPAATPATQDPIGPEGAVETTAPAATLYRKHLGMIRAALGARD